MNDLFEAYVAALLHRAMTEPGVKVESLDYAHLHAHFRRGSQGFEAAKRELIRNVLSIERAPGLAEPAESLLRFAVNRYAAGGLAIDSVGEHSHGK